MPIPKLLIVDDSEICRKPFRKVGRDDSGQIMVEVLEAETGDRVLYRTGTVYVGDPAGELIRGSRLAADTHGLPLLELDDPGLAELHPFLRRPEGYAALFEPDAGLLLCERAVAQV